MNKSAMNKSIANAKRKRERLKRNPIIREEMGKRLRYFRMEYMDAISQREMGGLFNVHQTVYNSYEQGTRAISDDMKLMLFFNYRCDLNWLITGQGDPLVESGKKKSNTTRLFAPHKIKKEISKITAPVQRQRKVPRIVSQQISCL